MGKNKASLYLFILFIFITFFFSGCSFNLNTEPSQAVDSRQSKNPTPKPIDGQFVFRLADNWSGDYPSVLGDKEFARLVEKRSNGKLKIIVYSDAVLGDEKSVIEQVQLGGIDFCRVNSAPVSAASNKLGVLSLPYLFRDSNHLWNVLLGPIGDEILDSLKPGGITGLAYYDSGARSFYTKKPIAQISDLSGLRIRVQQSETFESFIKSLGAIPIPMSFGQVYNSLQMDEIDGAENNWSSYLFTNHYKVAKYYILDEHTRNPEILIASNKLMDSLKEEYKQIIISAAKDSVNLQRKAWVDVEKKSEESIRKAGVVVIPVSENEEVQLREKIAPLYEKYGKNYESLIQRIKSTK